MSCVANRERHLNVHRSFFVVMTRIINVCEFEKKTNPTQIVNFFYCRVDASELQLI